MGVQLGRTTASGAATLGRSWSAVDVKRGWKEKWIYAPYLLALESTQALAPEIPTCDLLYRMGRLVFPGQSSYAQFDPLDLRPWYCRVRLLSDATAGNPVTSFWGLIDADTRALAPGDWAKGKQTFRAFGIEHLLDRNGLDYAYVDQDSVAIKIGWVPTFNAAGTRGAPIQGNRSASRDEVGVFSFGRYGATDFASRERVWTNYDVCEYLLERHPQAEKLREIGITLALTGAGAASLRHLRAVHDLAGDTLWEALGKLIDPHDGLTFRVKIGEDRRTQNTLFIEVISQADQTINVEGYEIAANPNRTRFTMPTAWPTSHLVGTMPIRRTSVTTYDEVVARGARVKITGPFCYDHGTLAEGWSSDREVDYGEAGGGDSLARDRARAADRYAAVYCEHVVPRSWDWRLGVAAGGTTHPADRRVNVAPFVRPEDGKVLFAAKEGPGPRTDFAKEFQRDTPFLEGWDYTTNPPTALAAEPDEEARYRPPLVFYFDGAAGAGPNHDADNQWHLVERLTEANEDLKSLHNGPLDRRLGVRIHASPRHYLGGGHFDATATPSETEAELKYEFLCVVATLESDARIEARWQRDGRPKKPPHRQKRPDGREFERRLVIDVPEAEYWYVTPGTPVDVAAGELVHIHDEVRVLRDDRPRLRAIVAFAAAWVGRERHAVQIPIARPGLYVDLGTYLESIEAVGDRTPVGTCVTARVINYRARQTTIETGFAAFDAVRLTGHQSRGQRRLRGPRRPR